MPIPTRSQSIRTALKPPLRPSEDQEAAGSATRSVQNADSKPQTHLTALPQPPRQPSAVGHIRNSSITSGLPRPQNASGATPGISKTSISKATSQSAKSAHQRSGSTVTKPLHNRSQSINVSEASVADERTVHSVRPTGKLTLPKPSFNTYQQHYSPQNPQQPARQQHSKVDAIDPNGHPTKEARYSSRLQDELLQLSLVHQRSIYTLNEYERSVQNHIDVNTRKLRKEAEVVSVLEAEHQKHVNALALHNWLDGEETSSKERKIQDFSFCINELAVLSTDGQLFNQIMDEFAQWLRKAQNVMKILSNDTTDLANDDNIVLSLDRPGAPWRQGVDECVGRLELCQRLLQDMGEVDAASGIGIVISRHRELASVMLGKLQTAQNIVDAFSATRQQWMTKALAAVIAEVRTDDANTPRKGIWSKPEVS